MDTAYAAQRDATQGILNAIREHMEAEGVTREELLRRLSAQPVLWPRCEHELDAFLRGAAKMYSIGLLSNVCYVLGCKLVLTMEARH